MSNKSEFSNWAFMAAVSMIAVAFFGIFFSFYSLGGIFVLFNWHPVLMILGFLCFGVFAALCFQEDLMKHYDHQVRKTFHVTFHTAAIVCIFTSLVIIIVDKGGFLPGYWHTWWGLLAITLYLLNWAGGLIAFWFGLVSQEAKETYMNKHRYTGLAAVLVAVIAVYTGIWFKLFSVVPEYGDLSIAIAWLLIIAVAALAITFTGAFLTSSTLTTVKMTRDEGEALLPGAA